MLADRVRELLADLPDVEEKAMFGGLCFMVSGKMCAGVIKDDLMCRINPDLTTVILEKHGCRPMDFTGKSMKGFVYIEDTALTANAALQYWINLCLEYNPIAKASKKKK